MEILRKDGCEQKLKALAVKVAKNCCVSMKRKKALKLTAGSNENGAECHIPSSDFDSLEAEECDALLEDMMQRRLTPRERELFELRRLDGFSNEEIEVRTGVKRTTVQCMVSKARTKLYLELKRRMNL